MDCYSIRLQNGVLLIGGVHGVMCAIKQNVFQMNITSDLTDQVFARALTLLQAGKPAMAETVYSMVLEIDPDHIPAKEGLLIARIQLGNRQAAKDYLEHCWATVRTDAEPYRLLAMFEYSLGVAEQGRNQMGLARMHFRRALVLAPDFVDAWRHEGTAAAYDSDQHGAVSGLVRATILNPADASALHTLGAIHLTLGALREAAACFARALSITDSADGRVGLGRALLAAGDAPAALVQFEHAVDLAPDQRNGWLGVMQALRAMGRHDAAAERLAAMVERFAAQPDDLFYACTEYLDMGDATRALDTYRAVVSAASDPARFPGVGPRILRRRRASELCAEKGWPYHRVQPPHRASFIDGTGARHDIEFPEIFLARVDQADIVTSTWAATCGDTLLVDGLLHFDPDKLLLLPEFPWTSPNGFVLADLEAPGATITEEAILLGGVANWAHLVQEWLSRLTVLERFPDLDHLPILVMPNLMRSVRELIGLLGIDTARLVPLPEARVIRAERLWIPSLTHRHKHASPLHIDFLRRRLAPHIAEGMRRPRRRLYMSRRTAAWRTLVNEREVLEALAPLGVEVVVPEEHSMAEQIAMFASAELVIGPLGGSSAAILFAPPGTGFVELTHSQLTIPQYAMLTATLHQRYRRIVGRTLANRGPTTYDFDFSVPPEDVVTACRALLAGR